MHKDLNLLKWSAAASALAIALIGCAGSDGTSGGTGGGATGTNGGLFPTVASANLPDAPGYAQISFLTGAGRAPNNSATIRRVALSDTFGTAETSLQAEKLLVFTNYNSQILPLNIPSVLGQPSRNFTQLQFDFVSYTAADGSVFDTITGLPRTMTADLRVFPGRQSHIPIFFDQDVITVGVVDGVPTASLDVDHFNAINFAVGDTQVVRSILSDYVSFDISSMADSKKPPLSDGSLATRMFFSGDSYALASSDPYIAVADFEQLIPAGQSQVIVGRCAGPASIPSGNGSVSTTPGTYSLLQVDPTDITNPIPRRISGLQGTWKEHFRQSRTNGGILDIGYLRNVHTFEAIAIPGSEDGARQDVIFVSQTLAVQADGTTRTTINELYWGYVDYEARTIAIYPAANLPSISADLNLAGEVTGTIGNQYNSGGTITNSTSQTRFADFTLSSPPVGFPASGTIVVLRR